MVVAGMLLLHRLHLGIVVSSVVAALVVAGLREDMEGYENLWSSADVSLKDSKRRAKGGTIMVKVTEEVSARPPW